jgi:SAM-dependent methyltransferase
MNWVDRHDPRIRFIRQLAAGAKVLDVGCGQFRTLNKLRQQRPDLQFCAVDVLPVESFCPHQVAFSQVDLETQLLPFPDEEFDAIFFCHVLEHLARPLLFLSEAKRVLKPGGQLYVEGPSTRSLFLPSFSFLKSRGSFQAVGDDLNFYDNFTHIRPLTKRSVQMFLELAACESQEIGYVRNPIKTMMSPFLVLLGLVLLRRRWLCVGLWELAGWSVYAIGSKKTTESSVAIPEGSGQ